MVDALASGASIGNDVEVRVLSWAPANLQNPYLYGDNEWFLKDSVPN